jgi:glycerophosphoryl diester phosphodiesterase
MRLAAVPLLLLAAAACGGDESAAAPSEEDPRLDAEIGVLDCIRTDGCADLFVVAHRGEHLSHPENSIAGLRAAAAMGVDMVEIDVRHTSDEVLVLMHDPDVDRTTDGSGEVSSLSYQQVAALTLSGSDPADPETERVPRFDDVLALARELGVALYIDQKTDRSDLVIAEIVAGSYADVAMIRDGLAGLEAAASQAPEVVVMPPVATEAELDDALAAIPALRIVEVSSVDADPTLTALIRQRGLTAQQDVMAVGDTPAMLSGDYSGWATFVDAGVSLMQTNFVELLLGAVWQYRRTGEFPASGPAGH